MVLRWSSFGVLRWFYGGSTVVLYGGSTVVLRWFYGGSTMSMIFVGNYFFLASYFIKKSAHTSYLLQHVVYESNASFRRYGMPFHTVIHMCVLDLIQQSRF